MDRVDRSRDRAFAFNAVLEKVGVAEQRTGAQQRARYALMIGSTVAVS